VCVVPSGMNKARYYTYLKYDRMKCGRQGTRATGSRCASYSSIDEEHTNVTSRYTCTNLLLNSRGTVVVNRWDVGGLL
jgi:hypothetical protein